jgi:hypothetical protein
MCSSSDSPTGQTVTESLRSNTTGWLPTRPFVPQSTCGYRLHVVLTFRKSRLYCSRTNRYSPVQFLSITQSCFVYLFQTRFMASYLYTNCFNSVKFWYMKFNLVNTYISSIKVIIKIFHFNGYHSKGTQNARQDAGTDEAWPHSWRRWRW